MQTSQEVLSKLFDEQFKLPLMILFVLKSANIEQSFIGIFVQNISLENILSFLNVAILLPLFNRCFCLLERTLILSIEFTYEKYQLQYPTKSNFDFFSTMNSIVLCQDKFSPQILNNPMTEIIILRIL